MTATQQLIAYLNRHPDAIGKVVDFDPFTERLFHFDLTKSNKNLKEDVFTDTEKFSDWIRNILQINNAKYGIGGYFEHRTIYARSEHFDTTDEPRRLHLGMDIWAEAGTKVYAPLSGTIHSFKNNDHFGDYGPTIILQHNLEDLTLYSLYGHLGKSSLIGLQVGATVVPNQLLATFGNSSENGHWPPHLHFQLMFDLEGNVGDYPGVCRFSEMEKYKDNIPDPQLIFRFPEPVNK
jgi:murein DD-endopeptidase MepM/ murein hydrolase activator NlpD